MHLIVCFVGVPRRVRDSGKIKTESGGQLGTAREQKREKSPFPNGKSPKIKHPGDSPGGVSSGPYPAHSRKGRRQACSAPPTWNAFPGRPARPTACTITTSCQSSAWGSTRASTITPCSTFKSRVWIWSSAHCVIWVGTSGVIEPCCWRATESVSDKFWFDGAFLWRE